MAQYNRFAQPYDQVLCESAALPNATRAKISTNVNTIDSTKAGNLVIRVFASNTTVELASSATLLFEPVVGTTTTCATVLPGVQAKEAVTSDVSWASGELICEIPIPKHLIGANRYLELYATTSGNESDDNVEAYLYVD